MSAQIGWILGAFVLGLISGWFACSHTDELVNLGEKEYLAVMHEIYTGHGNDHGMRDNLLAELKAWQTDIYLEREKLSNELRLMMERAGV